jgi:hypothetical protein
MSLLQLGVIQTHLYPILFGMYNGSVYLRGHHFYKLYVVFTFLHNLWLLYSVDEFRAEIAQSVERLATGWTTEGLEFESR